MNAIASARGLERPRGRAQAAARANLAGALGMVWASFGAPGSVLLTLFLQEWLHAAKWQIGLVMTMTFLGPTFEPPGAYLVERFGRRRALFIVTFLINRCAFLALAILPLLGSSPACLNLGIGVVLAVVGLTRVAAHLGTPAWWSWMADLVPDRCRGRFFGCRNRWASAVTALSFVIAMTLLHTCGGMNNPVLVSALFAVGAVFGILDILVYFRVPDMPLPQNGSTPLHWRQFLAPFRCTRYRRLIVGMGLWSFGANLVIPFLPLYQRGEMLAGRQLGLGASWLLLAALNVGGSLAAMATSCWWANWSGRVGPRRLLLIGSGYLFVNALYFAVPSGQLLGLLMAAGLLGGACNAAWTVGVNQLLVGVAPRENRSFYVSAFNFTNGWLMAGGPLLGGLLADRWPVLGWSLPGGLPCCYFHVLLLGGLIAGAIALIVLSGVPMLATTRGSVRSAPERVWLQRVMVAGQRTLFPVAGKAPTVGRAA